MQGRRLAEEYLALRTIEINRDLIHVRMQSAEMLNEEVGQLQFDRRSNRKSLKGPVSGDLFGKLASTLAVGDVGNLEYVNSHARLRRYEAPTGFLDNDNVHDDQIVATRLSSPIFPTPELIGDDGDNPLKLPTIRPSNPCRLSACLVQTCPTNS